MNLLRRSVVRLPIVVIGAAAWFMISNHCALAAFENLTHAPIPSCHAAMRSQPAPARNHSETDMQCCKVLRATLLTPASHTVAADDISVGTSDYLVVLLSLADELQLRGIFEWDTGPPGANSFAETVLQRSLLAHAPPVSLS
jgi:hypothetical protein